MFILFSLIIYSISPDIHKDDTTSFIRLPDNSGDFRIILIDQQNNQFSASGTGSEPVKVASGKFDLIDIRLYRTDENGNVWSTRSIIHRDLNIAAGETIDIPGLKGPDRAYVSTVNWSSEYYNFDFILEDKNKKRYGYFRKNNQLISNPCFIIENIDGKILFQGQFYTGCGGRLSYSGKIPDLPDVFYVRPVIDKGAFTEVEESRTEGNNIYSYAEKS
jgi:hypothetical protein